MNCCEWGSRILLTKRSRPSGVNTGEKTLHVVAIASSGDLNRWVSFYWNCIAQRNCLIHIACVYEPLSSRSSTTASWPYLADRWNGVRPDLDRRFGSAPWSIRSRTTCWSHWCKISLLRHWCWSKISYRVCLCKDSLTRYKKTIQNKLNLLLNIFCEFFYELQFLITIKWNKCLRLINW